MMERKRVMAVGCPTTFFIGGDRDILEGEGLDNQGKKVFNSGRNFLG